MEYIGDFVAGSTIRTQFNSRNSSGTPITLVGGTVSVYKDGNTTPSTAGVTLTTDFASQTGLHDVAITTASDGTFYATGHEYRAVITAGTVSGISVVGVCIAQFSISNRTESATQSAVASVASSLGTDFSSLTALIGTPAQASVLSALSTALGNDFTALTSQVGTPAQAAALSALSTALGTDVSNLTVLIGTPAQASALSALSSALSSDVAELLAALGSPAQASNVPTVDEIAARLLVNPNNKLVTDVDGKVTANATISDDEINSIASAVVTGIGATKVTVVSPLTESGKCLEIVVGDSYTAAMNRAPTLQLVNATGLVGCTAHIRINGLTDDYTSTPEITDPNELLTFADISVDVTSQFVNFPDEVNHQIQFQKTTGEVVDSATTIEGITKIRVKY